MKVKLFFLVFVSLTQFINISTAADYCSLCKGHIACQNYGWFKEKCPQDAKIVVLTDELKNSFVAEHNKFRNKMASGNESNFKSASKMNRLVWDNELANLAEFNVKQCEMRHDRCRSTKKFRNAGQNLYYKRSRPIFMPVNTTVIASVKSWYDEIKFASQSDFDKCCGGKKFDKIAHLLTMMQDKSTAIGCAVVMYTAQEKWKTFLIACNYGYGNVEEQPVYATGVSASKCDQKDPFHPALCIPKEGINDEKLEFVENDEPDEVEIVYIDDDEKS